MVLLIYRWKLVQLGLDDHYKRLNEVRGRDRLPATQVNNNKYRVCQQKPDTQSFNSKETLKKQA